MADRKISDLTALTTPASGDFLPIVDISEAAAASKNKRITIEELMRGVPDGTAAAPGIAFETYPSTGIYSSGANQLAVATNGTGRLFVDASGKVGVGTASPSAPLTFAASTGRKIGFYQGTEGYSIGVENSEFRFVTDAGGVFTFKNGGTYSSAAEFARIDSSGRLGIGTSSPQQELHINDATGVSRIRLTGGAVGADSFEIGQAIQGVSNTGFSIYDVEATASRLVIDSSGNVGIGFTAPEAALHAGANNGSPVIFAGAESGDITYKFRQSRGTITAPSDTGGEGIRLSFEKHSGAAWASPIAQIYAAGNGHLDGYLEFLTKPPGGSATPRARIDSSGRLLVGTSTSLQVAGGAEGQLQVANTSLAALSISTFANSSAGPYLMLGKSRGATVGSYTLLQNGDDLGTIRFGGADGTDLQSYGATIAAFVDGTPGANDMPGRIVLSTTAAGASSPTERMRLNSSGQLLVGTSSNFDGSTLQVNGNISQSSIFQQYAASFSGNDISTKTLNITVNNSITYATSLVEVKGSFARGTSSRRYYYQASFAIEETGATVSSLFGESADGVTASLSFSGQTASLVLTFSTVIKLGAVSVASINSSAAQYLTSVSWA
jgi:hypothetical protein